MNSDQFEEYLKGLNISELDKNNFRKAADKRTFFNNLIFFIEQKNAEKAVRRFHIYISKNSIFLRPTLKKSFLEIDDKMWSSLINRSVGYDEPTFELRRQARTTMENEVVPMIKKLEMEIHQILHNGGSL